MAWQRAKRSRVLWRALAAALLAGAVSGCAAITGTGPAADIYTLSAPEVIPDAGRTSRAQILIAMPHAVAALNSNNIAVVSDGIAISYFGGAAWSDNLPKLLQRKTIEAFQNSNRVRAVGQPGEGLLIDYQIATDIRAFQLDVDGSRIATVELAVKIINDRNGRVLATRTIHGQSPAKSDKAVDAVAALDRAANMCLVELVQWTLHKI